MQTLFGWMSIQSEYIHKDFFLLPSNGTHFRSMDETNCASSYLYTKRVLCCVLCANEPKLYSFYIFNFVPLVRLKVWMNLNNDRTTIWIFSCFKVSVSNLSEAIDTFFLLLSSLQFTLSFSLALFPPLMLSFRWWFKSNNPLSFFFPFWNFIRWVLPKRLELEVD